MNHRNIETYDLNWNGIQLKICTNPIGSTARDDSYKTAHLQLESVSPAKEPLPMTETGYRSHFTQPEDIDSAGGPVGYVQAWLEHAAQDPKWKAFTASRNQLSLF